MALLFNHRAFQVLDLRQAEARIPHREDPADEGEDRVAGHALGQPGLVDVLADVETRILGQPVIEALGLALLIGVAARNVLGDGSKPYAPGASLVAKHVLEVGVAFIGVSVYMPDILKAGPALLGLVLGGVGAGIVLSFTVGRLMGLNPHLAALVAIGNSICGNSAIAALAPVIGAEKKDVASAIGLTAVIGVLLVLGLPLLIAPFLLSNYQYGVLAGMSVYAVPQVVAAAFPVSELSGEVATLVKLSRVLLLGPAVVLIGRVSRTLLLALSLALYGASLVFEWNFPSWPGEGDWFFDPLCWQLLLVLGFLANEAKHNACL